MSQTEYARHLGIRLRKVRKEASKTLKDVAAACGVSEARVSQWEHGKGVPTVPQLAALSLLTGCDLNSLILGTEKILIDITDMWPGNILSIQTAVSMIQAHEKVRDQQWPATFERYKNWEGESPPDPPWYDELR